MVLVHMGETPSRDATPNAMAEAISDIARYSMKQAGGDPRFCYTARDAMRLSRCNYNKLRVIIGWFDGDVSGAPMNSDGVPLLAVAEEGIGIYSEYVAPSAIPDEIIPGGHVEGELVAYATVSASLRSHKSQADICLFPCDVEPQIGQAILDEAERIAASWGRTDLLLYLDEVHGDDVPCEASKISVASSSANAVARANGWALTQVERCSGATIPSDKWLAEHAGVKNPNYRLETFTDMIPDNLLPSLIQVANEMGTDAPSAGFEAEESGITVQQWRETEQFLMQDGTECIITVAIHGEQTVGYTELVIDPRHPVGQGDTIVNREHRGHGLGLAMKVKNLQVLRERHPDETRVYTWNAMENGPMLRINTLLGFEIVNLSGQWQKQIG